MFKYESIEELVSEAEKRNIKISELVLEDQAVSMEKTSSEIYEKMELSFQVMRDSVNEGLAKDLKSTSGLTGGEGYLMNEYADHGDALSGGFMARQWREPWLWPDATQVWVGSWLHLRLEAAVFCRDVL